MQLGLAGKTALVTGGSRGIGRAIAEVFVRSGMRVLVCARGRRDLDAATRALGCEVTGVRADVTRGADVRRLAAEVRRAFGRLDVLVNNAGTFDNFAGFSRTDLARWRRGFDSNFFSAVMVTRACLPLLRDGGRIVNILSTFAFQPPDRAPEYAAAKAALWNLTKFLSRELAPRRITVNAVAPGPVQTPSWEHEARALNVPLRKLIAEATRRVPLGRMGEPPDVAAAVAFLASAQAQWITGACLTVDGGATR